MAEDKLIKKQFRDICTQEVQNLMDIFEKSLTHLQKMSRTTTVKWQPDQPSLKHLHNHYVDVLLASYLAKHRAMTENIISSLNRFDYVGYTLNARCIVELTSTLRYYLFSRYLPIMVNGNVNLIELNKIHDQHLHGTRFDWETFISKDYSRMAKDVIQKIVEKKKKDKPKKITNRIQNQQINVMTTLESWANKSPGVMILYDLFCEMIHPNLGSTILVSSVKEGELFFGENQGVSAAHNLFETTWGWLLPIGYKEFGEILGQFILIKYQQDEL